MVESKQASPDPEVDGHSLAQYLVHEVMPDIDHPDPLNSLLSTLTLVCHRITSKNTIKRFQQLLKKDPMFDSTVRSKILKALGRENEDF
jgi:hypothetical protein